MRSRVFVNNKCKNSVNNVMKSICNSVCTTSVNGNINKEQVGELSVLTTSKRDNSRLCGNDSIKPVRYDASNSQLQPHTEAVGVKVRNQFEPLSCVVNDAFFNLNAGVSNDSISDATMNSSKSTSKNSILDTKTNNDGESIDYTSTTILKQVEKGKDSVCMRKVEVEKRKMFRPEKIHTATEYGLWVSVTNLK